MLQLLISFIVVFLLLLVPKVALDNKDYCEIVIDSSVKILSENTNGTGIEYGEMSAYNNLGNAVTITNTTDYFMVDDFSQGDLNGVTYANDQLTVTKAGVYKVDWSLSFSGGASDEYIISVFVNDAVSSECEGVHRKLGASGDVGSTGGTCLINLSGSDTVDLRIRNIDSTANANAYFQNVNVIILDIINSSSLTTETLDYNYDRVCFANTKTTEDTFYNSMLWFIRFFAIYIFLYFNYVLWVKNKLINWGFIQKK